MAEVHGRRGDRRFKRRRSSAKPGGREFSPESTKGRANAREISSHSCFPISPIRARNVAARRQRPTCLVEIKRDYCYITSGGPEAVISCFFVSLSLYLGSLLVVLRRRSPPFSIQFYYDGCTSGKLTFRGRSVNFCAHGDRLFPTRLVD